MTRAVNFLCLLTFALPAAAQFAELATTSDASVLYFSSPVRPKGSSNSFNFKIFRWDPVNSFQIVAEVADPGAFTDCTTANFYQLHSPQVSADGSILAYTGMRPFNMGPAFQKSCPSFEPDQGVLQMPTGRTMTLAGSLALTPGGGYAITTPLIASANNFHIVNDLASGASTVVAGFINGLQRRVSDQAAIVTPENAALILTDRNGGTRVIQTQRLVGDVAISRSGATLLYTTPVPIPGAAAAIDVASGVETTLVESLTAASSPGLTSDGSTALFVGANQVYLKPTAPGHGDVRKLTSETDGIAAAVISGDGTTVYASTIGGRLLHIDVASARVTQIAAPTPVIAYTLQVAGDAAPFAAPGSLLQLVGSTSFPSLTVCGKPAAVISLANSGNAAFQVPLDVVTGACQILAQSDLFESGITITIRERFPEFLPGAVFHQNFTSLITSSAPAAAGEIISVYLTGMGRVDATGRVGAGFSCNVGGVSSDVQYAGLAPGLSGIYQVNLAVPSVPAGQSNLTCGWVSDSQASTMLWVGP